MRLHTEKNQYSEEKMEKQCDIIIPVYNSPEWLELCVEAAIRSDISCAIRQIILVDDCSDENTQHTIQSLCAQYKQVISIRNTENLGFIKTCNRGMKLCKSDAIMLLNSDCLLAVDTTARLLLALEKEPDVGLICPLSNNAANLSVLIPPQANYVQVDQMLSELPNTRYQACTVVGNCLVITRECYEAVGGLDEAFGMGYGEETDYQFRADAAGFKAVVAGNAYVFHKSQVSFGNSEKLSEQKRKNRELFFERWGKEYSLLMKEYVKHDPAKVAASYVTKHSGKLVELNTGLFDQAFLDRVDRIDRKENATPQLSAAEKCKELIKKVVRRIRLIQ